MAKRVAVVAVHGVADQQPNDSARQVASLLTDFSGGQCESLGEDRLHIPLAPVLPPMTPKCKTRGVPERSEWVREQLKTPANPPGCSVGADAKSASYQFMKNQLVCYQTDEERRAFDTIRIRLQQGSDTFDVYEAYWADLSRLGSGLVVFFTQLYQLLLHLPSLGRIVTDYEASLQGASASWRAFSRVQGWAVRTLTLGIALMNLALATLIAPLVAAHFSRRMQEETLWLVAASVTAVLCVAIAGYLLSRIRPFEFVWYAAPPWIAFGAFIGGFYAARAIQGPVAIALLAWLAGFALACALLHQYDVRRPHAMTVGVIFMVLTLVVFAQYLWRMKSDPGIAPGACLKTFVAIDALLTLVWGIHITLMVAALIIGWIASRKSCPERTEEARNASWTARATLALSTSLFASLTLAGWMAVTKSLGSLVKDDGISVNAFGDLHTFQEVIDGILLPNVRLGFTLVALTTAFLIVALIWSIFPSVQDEVKPPDVAESTKPERSTRLGVWLTTGLDALPRAVDVFSLTWVLMFLVGVGHVVWTLMNPNAPGSFLEHLIFATQYPNFAPSTVLLSLSGALLLTMIGAQVWLPAAGGALDVGLDVDNYLREHPVDDTPRARFAERFISLFRHLRAEGYDAIVFVAHSQGTVITADLLRFLRIDGTEAPFAPKTILFTMGCPLRQLYWRAFPPLYDWMTNEKDLPKETGVAEWVNNYRSGDYVGRWVWYRHDSKEWQPGADWNPASNITDGCIGAGAHVHYWDGTADRIGAQLQEILARV